jgi:hypothetical protein
MWHDDEGHDAKPHARAVLVSTRGGIDRVFSPMQQIVAAQSVSESNIHTRVNVCTYAGSEAATVSS